MHTELLVSNQQNRDGRTILRREQKLSYREQIARQLRTLRRGHI